MSEKLARSSVIICTVRRTKELALCIDSLLSQGLLPNEIIVVDASRDEETRKLIEEYRSKDKEVEFKYIHSQPKLTLQRNIGFKASSGDIIFYFDDDVILENNYVSAIIKTFEADLYHEIGGVAGLIIGQDVKKQKSIKWKMDTIFRKLFFLEHCFGNGKFRLSGFPTTVPPGRLPVFVESLPGGLSAYRRQVMDEFQFDEDLSGYCYMEDCDFSYRVSRKYKCIRNPEARLFHDSVQPKKSFSLKKMLICNHYYLFHKNFPQTFKHKIAFWISFVGCFLKEILSMNGTGLMGLFSGLRFIVKGSIGKKHLINK